MKRLAKIAVSAAIVSSAVIGLADQASAKPKDPAAEANKSCTSEGEEYTHGSLLVTYIRIDGKLHTAYVYKCNNGKWEKVPPKAKVPADAGVVIVDVPPLVASLFTAYTPIGNTPIGTSELPDTAEQPPTSSDKPEIDTAEVDTSTPDTATTDDDEYSTDEDPKDPESTESTDDDDNDDDDDDDSVPPTREPGGYKDGHKIETPTPDTLTYR